jgi:hypothetical protein
METLYHPVILTLIIVRPVAVKDKKPEQKVKPERKVKHQPDYYNASKVHLQDIDHLIHYLFIHPLVLVKVISQVSANVIL